jgi:hypothetical protein
MSMTSTQREELRENVRAIIAGRDDGIELDTEFRWAVSGINKPEPFFKNLSVLLPSDSILYFEGCSISSDVAAFYEANETSNSVPVVPDTIFPISERFHVSFSQDVLIKLCELAASRRTNELFDHVKAYQGRTLLLHFHDAFENIFLISDKISEPAVTEFSNRLGGSYRREQNVNKRIEGLQGLLKVLENPSKVRIQGESWWSRIWRRLTWR